MKSKLANFIGIDLGSSKISAIAALITNSECKILESCIHASEGFKSGVIIDFKQAENSIISTIYSLERLCGKNIKNVAISISGVSTKSSYVYNKIKINGTISAQDVKKLLQKTLNETKPKDEEIIHYFPMEYTIDENTNVQDPIGMYAKELICKLHIITLTNSVLLNIMNCFAKCQVEVDSIVLAIYADALTCLTEDEKKIGTIIIDAGAKTTSWAIVLENKVLYTSHIPIGSWHITSDIANALSINFNIAEKIKILYGNAMYATTNTTIPLDELQDTSINTKDLTNIINPRAEEIIELIKNEFDKIGIDHLISRKIVITGGGACLSGFKELIGIAFEKQVRMSQNEINQALTTSVGIANYMARNIKHIPSKGSSKIFTKFIDWFKHNV